MLDKLFEKPRYMIAAVGGLISLQGFIFMVIEPSRFATIVTVVGMFVVVAMMFAEILAAIRLVSRDLCADFARFKEQRRLSTDERKRQAKLQGGTATKSVTKPAVELQIPASNKTERLIALSSEPTSVPCPFCGEAILSTARKCKHCGEFLDDELARERRPVVQRIQPLAPKWNRGFAALWSLFIPGAGHFYKGNVIEGVGWLVLTPVILLLWPVFGVILYLLCIMSAASGDTNKT